MISAVGHKCAMTRALTRFVFIASTLVSIMVATPITAQEGGSNHRSWQVFVRHSIDTQGRDELIFVDMISGEGTAIASYGERYSISSTGVVFYDAVNRRVMLATPDGILREHPFIRVAAETHRVEWVISDDGGQIAWTLTRFDLQHRLTTLTTVANIDGTGRRSVLTDVDTDERNMRISPMAFIGETQTLYLDTAHLDGISQYIAFAQFVSLYALDVQTGDMTPMPGELGNCICGAAMESGLFLRLRLTPDLAGFDFYVYDVDAGTETVIPALRLVDYNTAGDILVSPDGNRAVYALAQISDFGSSQQPIRTVIVLVDLGALTQEALTNPLTTFVRPVAWTEDNSAVIFTSPNQDGTWKISLSDGRLDRIAEASYIGELP